MLRLSFRQLPLSVLFVLSIPTSRAKYWIRRATDLGILTDVARLLYISVASEYEY